MAIHFFLKVDAILSMNSNSQNVYQNKLTTFKCKKCGEGGGGGGGGGGSEEKKEDRYCIIYNIINMNISNRKTDKKNSINQK